MNEIFCYSCYNRCCSYVFVCCYCYYYCWLDFFVWKYITTNIHINTVIISKWKAIEHNFGCFVLLFWLIYACWKYHRRIRLKKWKIFCANMGKKHKTNVALKLIKIVKIFIVNWNYLKLIKNDIICWRQQHLYSYIFYMYPLYLS